MLYALAMGQIKMETRNPVEGYFGSGFLAICNHCRVMVAWSRKTLKIFENFFAFFEKTIPYSKILKFSFVSFHRDSDRRVVFKFSEIWPTGNRWNRALLTWQTNKSLPGSPAVANTRIVPRNLPAPAPDNILRVLQISSKLVHFRRS